MNCPKCGKENPEQAEFCQYCRCTLTNQTPKHKSFKLTTTKLDKLAITAIVIITCFIIFTVITRSRNSIIRTRGLACRMRCGTNMSGLGKAIMVYANDNDEQYPTPKKWCDLLIKYADVTPSQLRCKGDKIGPSSYAMNTNIQALGPDAPPKMVLLFESISGWNLVGGPEHLNTRNHNGKGCTVLFNDLHVEFVRTEDVNNLCWTPESCEPQKCCQ